MTSDELNKVYEKVLRALRNSAGQGAVYSERMEGFDEGLAYARAQVRDLQRKDLER